MEKVPIVLLGRDPWIEFISTPVSANRSSGSLSSFPSPCFLCGKEDRLYFLSESRRRWTLFLTLLKGSLSKRVTHPLPVVACEGCMTSLQEVWDLQGRLRDLQVLFDCAIKSVQEAKEKEVIDRVDVSDAIKIEVDCGIENDDNFSDIFGDGLWNPDPAEEDGEESIKAISATATLHGFVENCSNDETELTSNLTPVKTSTAIKKRRSGRPKRTTPKRDQVVTSKPKRRVGRPKKIKIAEIASYPATVGVDDKNVAEEIQQSGPIPTTPIKIRKKPGPKPKPKISLPTIKNPHDNENNHEDIDGEKFQPDVEQFPENSSPSGRRRSTRRKIDLSYCEEDEDEDDAVVKKCRRVKTLKIGNEDDIKTDDNLATESGDDTPGNELEDWNDAHDSSSSSSSESDNDFPSKTLTSSTSTPMEGEKTKKRRRGVKPGQGWKKRKYEGPLNQKQQKYYPIRLPKYPCSKCGKKFDRRKRHVYHEVFICKIPYDESMIQKNNCRLFYCDLCPFAMAEISDIRKHYPGHQAIPDLYKCPECSEGYPSIDEVFFHQQLTLHKKGYTSNEPAFKALAARLETTLEGILTGRIRGPNKIDPQTLIHSRKKEFANQCVKCGKTFARLSRRVRHEVYVCKVEYTEETLTQFKYILLKCDQCEEFFNDRAKLATHYASHTGIKPHGCSECELTFRHAFRLRTHFQVSGHKSGYTRHVYSQETLDAPKVIVHAKGCDSGDVQKVVDKQPEPVDCANQEELLNTSSNNGELDCIQQSSDEMIILPTYSA